MNVQRIVFATLALVAAILILNFAFLFFVFVPGSLFILPLLLGGAGLILYSFLRPKGTSSDAGKNIEKRLASPPTSDKGQKRAAVFLFVCILLMFGIIGLALLRLRAI